MLVNLSLASASDGACAVLSTFIVLIAWRFFLTTKKHGGRTTKSAEVSPCSLCKNFVASVVQKNY